MRALLLLALLAGPLQAQGWNGDATELPGVGHCLPAQMDAFEARLADVEDGPRFTLIGGTLVGECAGIALMQCGGDTDCRAAVTAQITALAERLADVPEPAEVEGQIPPLSYGLYAQQWHRVRAECFGCTPLTEVERLGAAARLWQMARVVGVVEAEAWR